MSNGKLIRVRKAGSGAYGTVYLATSPSRKNCSRKTNSVSDEKEQNDNSEKEFFAVKRNFKEKDIMGYSGLKECNIMLALRNHPYIVNLLDVKRSNPFVKSTKRETPTPDKDLVDDKMYFVMEFLPFDGETYIDKGMGDCQDTKIMIMQLLLAVEFMHSQDVMHRDIKTANILIEKDKSGNFKLKLCDFGLSKFMGDGVCTPGTVTSWYRAPEICCNNIYNKKIDVWSVGCVFYEFLSGKPLLNRAGESDEETFNKILSLMPKQVDRRTISSMFKNGSSLKINPSSLKIKRKSFVEQMMLSESTKSEFNETGGSLAELEDLLQKMLTFDPLDRVSASRALDHPFFKEQRGHIDSIRQIYDLRPPSLPFYEIYPCIERTWVVSLVHNMYNSNKKSKRGKHSVIKSDVGENETCKYLSDSQSHWYSDNVIFHSLDLFDQYLAYCFTDGNVTLRATENRRSGRIHTLRETMLRFYVCLYTVHKYYSTLKIPYGWDDFVPQTFLDDRSINDAEDFEELIAFSVTKLNIYRKTLLEIAIQFESELTDVTVRDFLIKMGKIKKPWLDGSVRALYRKFRNIPDPKK
jgi:serine/threonine protein kinase